MHPNGSSSSSSSDEAEWDGEEGDAVGGEEDVLAIKEAAAQARGRLVLKTVAVCVSVCVYVQWVFVRPTTHFHPRPLLS